MVPTPTFGTVSDPSEVVSDVRGADDSAPSRYIETRFLLRFNRLWKELDAGSTKNPSVGFRSNISASIVCAKGNIRSIRESFIMTNSI